MEYDIFISYRRDGGADFAGRIVDHLKNRGYTPFMDLESMKSGRFDIQLRDRIDECKHFILILSPKSLNRCTNPSDWVRNEVEYAIEKRKHIITIQMPGFDFPNKLPDSMEMIKMFQSVFYSPETFVLTVDRAVDFLEDKKWTPEEYDRLLSDTHKTIKRKKLCRFLIRVFGLLMFATLISYFVIKCCTKKEMKVSLRKLTDMQRRSMEQPDDANVGDLIYYRVEIENVDNKSNPYLYLDLDKSLSFEFGGVVKETLSLNEESIDEESFARGLDLSEYVDTEKIEIYFTVRVINYDLKMSGNELYTKVHLVDGDKRVSVYDTVNVNFFDDTIDEGNPVTGWGDSNGGRDVYTTYEVNEQNVLGDKIVFNSITDWKPIGDERNFVATRKDSGINEYNVWQASEITVTEEGTYLVRMYVHNNNPKGFDGIAKDVSAYVIIPTETAKKLGVYGVIKASNANPTKYWDGVTFKSNREFSLQYVKNSAILENNGIGVNGGCPLRDSIITSNGVKLGYESLDGNVPGGAEYAAYISFKVKAVFVEKQDFFEVETSVRKVGDKEWHKELEVSIGDEVEYLIRYKNSSNALRKNVMTKAVPPKSIEYVDGSTFLYTSRYPDGVKIRDTIETGLNIGAYAVGGAGNVVMRYKISDSVKLNTEKNILRFWGQVDDGTITLQDYADILLYLKKE